MQNDEELNTNIDLAKEFDRALDDAGLLTDPEQEAVVSEMASLENVEPDSKKMLDEIDSDEIQN